MYIQGWGCWGIGYFNGTHHFQSQTSWNLSVGSYNSKNDINVLFTFLGIWGQLGNNIIVYPSYQLFHVKFI